MGKGKQEGFKQNLLSRDDKEVTVKMQYFETVECIIKIGRVSKPVDTKSKNANFFLLLDFTSSGFPKIINHQNHFKNYCKTIYLFRDWFKLFSQQFFWGISEPTSNVSTSLFTDLTSRLQFIQVLWNTVVKSYHPCLSDNKKYGCHFAHLAINEMFSEAELSDGDDTYVVIEREKVCFTVQVCNWFQ